MSYDNQVTKRFLTVYCSNMETKEEYDYDYFRTVSQIQISFTII